jgi:hypothetical protein
MNKWTPVFSPCLVFLILLQFNVWGIDSITTPQLPSPPYVVNAPTYSSWIIQYQPKNKPPAANVPANPMLANLKPARIIKEIQVTKADKTRRTITHWTDGAAAESWMFEGYLIKEQPDTKEISVFNLNQRTSANAIFEDFANSDFPEFSWVKGEVFIDVSLREKIKCFFYKSTEEAYKNFMLVVAIPSPSVSTNQPAVFPIPKVLKQGWIDAGTKLPICLEEEEYIKIYKFAASSDKLLVLPQRFLEEYQGFKNKIGTQAKHRMRVE